MNEWHRTPVSSTRAARQLLDVRRDADEQELRRAFRQAARVAHPDGGGTSGDLADLRRARDLLLDVLNGDQHAGGRERVFVRRRRRLARATDRLLQRRRHARRGHSRKVL